MPMPIGPIAAAASEAISVRRGVLGMIIADARIRIGDPRRTADGVHGHLDVEDLEQGDEQRR